MEFSIEEGFINIAKLLILNGASNKSLNKYTVMTKPNELKCQHVDDEIVKKVYEKMKSTMFHNYMSQDSNGSMLLNWGKESLVEHATFVNVVMMAIFTNRDHIDRCEETVEDSVQDSHARKKSKINEDVMVVGGVQQEEQKGRCMLPELGGSVGLVLLIASFIGVQFGRKLKNVREFTSCLKSIEDAETVTVKQEQVTSSSSLFETAPEEGTGGADSVWGDMLSPTDSSSTTQSKRILWSP